MTTVIEYSGRPVISPGPDPGHYESEAEVLNFQAALDKLEQHLESSPGLTERDILTVLTIGELLRLDHASSQLFQASAFVLHTAVINLYPLSSRRFYQASQTLKMERFLLDFSRQSRIFLRGRSYERITKKFGLRCDLIDIVDGRVLHVAAQMLAQDASFRADDASLLSEYQRLMALTKTLCNIDLCSLTAQDLDSNTAPEEVAETQAENASSSLVMPFGNPTFDHYLAPVRLMIDEESSPRNISASASTFRELSHWHNHNKLLCRKGPPPRIGFFALRRNQKYMAEMVEYAGSLTNAVGKTLKPETVVDVAAPTRGNDQVKSEREDSKTLTKGRTSKPNPKNKQAKPNTGKAAAHAAAAASQEGKDDKKRKQFLTTWASRCKEFQGHPIPIDRFTAAEKFWKGLKTLEKAAVGGEVELYIVSSLILMWIDSGKKGTFGKSATLSIEALDLDRMPGSS
jgi:ATP-dependent RNA helicase DDX60